MRLNLEQWIKKKMDIETDLVVSTGLREEQVTLKDAKPILDIDGKEKKPVKTIWVVEILSFLPFPITVPFENYEKARHFRDKYFPCENE